MEEGTTIKTKNWRYRLIGMGIHEYMWIVECGRFVRSAMYFYVWTTNSCDLSEKRAILNRTSWRIGLRQKDWTVGNASSNSSSVLNHVIMLKRILKWDILKRDLCLLRFFLTQWRSLVQQQWVLNVFTEPRVWKLTRWSLISTIF